MSVDGRIRLIAVTIINPPGLIAREPFVLFVLHATLDLYSPVDDGADAIFLVIDLVPMRRYECFRRRERFLGVLVFAKLIRISIADILVVSVITRARCKTEPKAPPVDEISNLPVHLGSLLPLNGSVPSLLLSINIADWHTSKQDNGRLHTSCIFCSKKKGTLPDAFVHSSKYCQWYPPEQVPALSA